MACKKVFPGSEKQTGVSVPCVNGTEDLTHFFLKCSSSKDKWEFFWESLVSKIEICCPHEPGTFKILSFNLNDESKGRLFLGG